MKRPKLFASKQTKGWEIIGDKIEGHEMEPAELVSCKVCKKRKKAGEPHALHTFFMKPSGGRLQY